MGTPDFAAVSLRALHEDPRTQVTLVVSQPDRTSGRGQKLTPTPVKQVAIDLGLPTFQPESMREEDAVARLQEEQADLFVVAAYGQILRQNVLDLPRLGCVNVHASLLPRWRGAAPIHRAIEAGDSATGVSIMRMERGLDTGPVYAMSATMIGDTETAGELHDRLAEQGAQLLVRTLDDIADPDFVPTPQPNLRTTYARMLKAEDKALEFDAPALHVCARVNGMSPWPSVSAMADDLRLTLLRARPSDVPVDEAAPGTVLVASAKYGLHIACADGAIEVLEIKRPGKRAMSTADCLRGIDLVVGSALTS